MSTQNRTAHRGGKNSKLDSVPLTKSQKNDSKMDTNKILDNPKAQPTAEQMRIAQIIDRRTDDSKLKEKIKQVYYIIDNVEFVLLAKKKSIY